MSEHRIELTREEQRILREPWDAMLDIRRQADQAIAEQQEKFRRLVTMRGHDIDFDFPETELTDEGILILRKNEQDDATD